METPQTEMLNWQKSQPLSLQQKTELLSGVGTKLQKEIITPHEALNEASFAFNTLTDYGSLDYDSRVLWLTDIYQYQHAAQIFKQIAERTDGDTRIYFRNDTPDPSESIHSYSENLREYADLLEASAQMQMTEKLLQFGAKSPIIRDAENRPSIDDSVALSALLFEEQWREYQRNSDRSLVDPRQITLLCEQQVALEEINDNQSLSPIDRKTVFDSIKRTLDSALMDESEVKTLPTTTAIMYMQRSRAIYELGRLSEDGNQDDFIHNRQDSTILAAEGTRQAKLYIEKAAQQTPADVVLIDYLKENIIYYHDLYSEDAFQKTGAYVMQQLAERSID